MSKNPLVGLQIFTYFPEEFPAQVSKSQACFFSGFSESRRQGYLCCPSSLGYPHHLCVDGCGSGEDGVCVCGGGGGGGRGRGRV